MEWWNIPANPNSLIKYNLDNHQWLLATHILLVLSSLSFVFGSFVFISYLLFKHKFPSRLITYFSLATSLDAATILALSWSKGNVLKSTEGCTAQGTINQFLASAAILWWMCITVNLYATFVRNRKIAHYEIHMHVFCWGGALVMTIPPAVAGQMGEVGLWCWIQGWKWQLGAYYLIMGLVCLIGGYMWVSIISSISSLTQRYKFSDRSAVSVHVVRQSLFIIWFWIIFCFMFIHRVCYHATDHSPFPLMLLHLAAMGSQGIFIFLVFGMRLEIACFWRNLLFHACCSKCTERGAYHSLK